VRKITKRVKVFQAGKYPQGEFSESKVQEIFGNVKEAIQGIFIHSSKWEQEGKEPIQCGEFSNFSVENGTAFADLSLNNKGQEYYNDGIFKGISVELSNGLKKIALLPLGVNPAITGAEFQLEFEEVTTEELPVNNFEEEEKMTLEEVKAFLMTAGIGDKIEVMSSIVGSLSEADTRAARALAYEFADKTQITVDEFAKEKGIEIEIKEAKVAKTEEEIRAEIQAEFEAKDKAKTELQEFEAELKAKVLPAHREAYRMAFIAAQGQSELLEFEEGKGKMTAKAHLLSKVKGMTNIELLGEFAQAEGTVEFSEEQKAAKEIEAAKKRAEGIK